MDASLLETEYDAVLVGTGMVEAILAGALARVGKKVLHLDQNDYYGSNYASFPLKQFLQWTRNESAAPRRFDQDDDDVDNAPTSSNAAIRSIDSTVASVHTIDVPLINSLQCALLDTGFVDAATEAAMLRASSAFSLDMNPRLVLSSEELVETLITSGVGQYLEFTAVQHTYVHLQPASPPPAVTTTAPHSDTVWPVPCSKRDVFQSKLLSMVEKRQLMKFLQFVADYGETHIAGEDVGTKNERSLALGRALKRPQNKTNQAAAGVSVRRGSGTSATSAMVVASFLDRPFHELLAQHFGLSPTLQRVVVYCVALASFAEAGATAQLTSRDGLAAVYRYVASIGRFAATAFLAPLYGVSEIAQSFCRLCAVYGGIYVLRAPITAFVFDPAANRIHGIRTSDGGVVRAKHVIVNGSYVDSFASPQVPAQTPRRERTHGQILRGVFVLRTSLRKDASRLLIVIPPNDLVLENPVAVQIVQLDHGASVCPADFVVVHVSMPLPRDWLDDRAKQLALVTNVMEQLVTSALAEQRSGSGKPASKAPVLSSSPVKSDAVETVADTNAVEALPGVPQWMDAVAWRAVYTMDHLASSPSATSSLAHRDAASRHLPVNLWPCETRVVGDPSTAATARSTPVNPLEIHLESASANARAIFAQLCPNDAFLPKSASAEQAEKDALDDEHGAVLQAAQKLAAQTSLSATTATTAATEAQHDANDAA